MGVIYDKLHAATISQTISLYQFYASAGRFGQAQQTQHKMGALRFTHPTGSIKMFHVVIPAKA